MSTQLSNIGYIITSAGGGITFDVGNPTISYYNIHTDGVTVTLVNNMTFSPNGVPKENEQFELHFTGNVELDGFDLEFFGLQLTEAQALASYIIRATYTNCVWNVKLELSQTLGGFPSVSGASIQADSIDGGNSLIQYSTNLDRIQQLTDRGYILRSITGGTLSDIQANSAGYFVMGDGVDVVSQPITGAITVDGTGTATIPDGSIGPEKLTSPLSGDLIARVVLTSAQVLTLNSVPIEVIPAPGAGFQIEVTRASAKIKTYGGATYTTNTRLYLRSNGALFPQMAMDTGSSILDSTNARAIRFEPTSVTVGYPGVAESSLIEGASLQAFVPVGEPQVGTSDVELYIQYSLVELL